MIEFNNHSFLKKTFQGGEQSSNRRDFLNVLFSFLTLFLCFQHFHNNVLLNKERALDSVMDTFSTHGPTIGSANMFLHFRQLHENFRSHSTNAPKSAWAHTTHGFWCFPNLLGINNSITRGLRQPGFVRGCIVGTIMNASRCRPQKFSQFFLNQEFQTHAQPRESHVTEICGCTRQLQKQSTQAYPIPSLLHPPLLIVAGVSGAGVGRDRALKAASPDSATLQ